MIRSLKDKLKRVIASERSPARLARSCALGGFIAFSPFLGIQTLLIFLLGWLFKTNILVTFTVVYSINNPWTMLPIAVLDYIVGSWLLNSLLCINLDACNPAWMSKFNGWLNYKLSPLMRSYLGASSPVTLSLWSFLIGGTVLALFIGVITYFWSYRYFKRFIERSDKKFNQNK